MRRRLVFLWLTVVCVALIFSAPGVEGGKQKRLLALLALALLKRPKKLILPLPIPLPIPIHKVEHQYIPVETHHSYGGHGGGYGGSGGGEYY